MQTSAKRSVFAGLPVKHIGLLALIVAVIFGMTAISGNAQSTHGTILGTITDQSGAVLPDTVVTLINQATGTKMEATSNGSGYYQFVDVAPSTYTINVTKQGFKALTRPGIVLPTQARIQVDLSLTVGASTETVEVTASTPLIQADNVSLGTVVDQRQTNELPLNGRNVMNLTSLVPSVIPLGETQGSPTGMNPFGWGNYQIGGGMAGWSSTYMDGAPDNGIYFNNVEIIPSQDSVAEFKVETNDMSADYGKTGGGVINFVTKSGTKNYHGSAWEFIRNKIFNSNSYFANHGGQGGAPLPLPPYTQNQYGANFGGPVIIPHLYNGSKRTFVFANWEGFGLRQGVTYTTTVPDAAGLALNLSEWGRSLYDPTTTCPTAGGCTAGFMTRNGHSAPALANQGDREPLGWDDPNYVAGHLQTTTAGLSDYANPTSVAYMKKMFPAPTNSAAFQSNYTANASSGGNNYQFITRGDHDISDHQHLMVRYAWWDNINLAADPLKDGVCGQGECTEHYRMHNFLIDDTYTISSKMILDTRINYNRYGYARVPLRPWTVSDYSDIGWTAGMAALTEFPGPPVFVVPSWDPANLFSGQGADSTILDYQDTYRAAGTLTRFVGNHTLKFGAEFTLDRFNYAQSNTTSGIWYFNQGATTNSSIGANVTSTSGLDIATYLLGYANGGGGSWYALLTASEIKYPAVFVTDDWRATQKLTFHLGARWERVSPFTERHDRISLFDGQATNDTLTYAGMPGVLGNLEIVNTPEHPSRFGVNPDNMQFSPHMGVSYRVAANTVINSGFGLFWLPNYLSTNGNPGWDSTVNFTTPYVYSTNGWTPTSNMSEPYPLINGQPGIIKPPGHNSRQFQQNFLGNGFTVDIPTNPYAYTSQWNFGIQQQLGKTIAIDASYAGAIGVHLPVNNGSFPLDALDDSYLVTYGIHGTLNGGPNPNLSDRVPNPYQSAMLSSAGLYSPTMSFAQSLSPYPEFNGASGVLNVTHSSYHALEVKMVKRFGEGGSVNVAYTFAKLEANTDTLATWLEGGITGLGDFNNMKGEKSLSSTDVPQRLVVAYVYDIPVGRGKAFLPNVNRVTDEIIGGWGLQGLTTLMKGFPIGISQRINRIGSNHNGSSRPDVVPGCNKNIGGSAVSKLHGWYNTACFTESQPYIWGNESRNDATLENPGMANWDLSIVKKFPINADGTFNFQFRAEFYNLFNRVQFGPSNGQFDNVSQPGWVTSQLNQPRVAQFALRLTF